MFTAASLFLSLELYAETLHITRGAGTLLVGVANSSTFQQLNSSLHDPIYQEGFEGIVESVHEYGRDFISSTVQVRQFVIFEDHGISMIWIKLLFSSFFLFFFKDLP